MPHPVRSKKFKSRLVVDNNTFYRRICIMLLLHLLALSLPASFFFPLFLLHPLTFLIIPLPAPRLVLLHYICSAFCYFLFLVLCSGWSPHPLTLPLLLLSLIFFHFYHPRVGLVVLIIYWSLFIRRNYYQ